MKEDLIKVIKKLAISVTAGDIPEVLCLGIDTFLLRRGVNVPEKSILELYLILNDIRVCSSPITTSTDGDFDNNQQRNC